MLTKGRGEAAGRPRPNLAAAKAGIVAGRTGGGAAGADQVPVSLRFPRGVLARVNKLVDAQKAENPIPRTTWLLDAVNEKLAREEKKATRRNDAGEGRGR